MLSDSELDAIEARANAATQGPWTVGRGDVIAKTWGWYELDVCASVDAAANLQEEADVIFIAHAREDVPALATELRSARKRLQAVETVLPELRALAGANCIAQLDECADELEAALRGAE